MYIDSIFIAGCFDAVATMKEARFKSPHIRNEELLFREVTFEGNPVGEKQGKTARFRRQYQAAEYLGQVISHSRSTVFQMAEVAVSEILLTKPLARIHGLRYALG